LVLEGDFFSGPSKSISVEIYFRGEIKDQETIMNFSPSASVLSLKRNGNFIAL